MRYFNMERKVLIFGIKIHIFTEKFKFFDTKFTKTFFR